MWRWSVLVLLFGIPSVAETRTVVDYAEAANRTEWLRHPVYGDASFDSFTHHATNPVHRGEAPYEWPVNGFLFEDPVSLDWFLFVGHYRTGYRRDVENPSRATVFRSRDKGESWEDLGPVFPPEEHLFEGEVSPMGSAPDVAVTFHEGRYHMSYDWSTRNSTWANAADPPQDANSGAGYAWAERPEGPYHRTSIPIATTRDQPLLEGKYKRVYASTILRRKDDWLVLTLTDSGPYFGWAYLGMTAKSPEGPYTSPKLLLYPERDGFHPPLMEFHPAFARDGHVYAPATSVAMNRNFQMLWRAPVEEAMEPEAWEIFRHGSLWHSDPVENEAHGIWGQTFSGFIDDAGTFRVMFPSRDRQGMGTINIASRPWESPYRERGFHISGHEGPSFVRLKRGGTVRRIEAALDVYGTAITLVWNAKGPVGPNRPTSNASLHPLMLGDYAGLRLRQESWTLVTVNSEGESETIAEGDVETPGRIESAIAWDNDDKARLTIHGKEVWSGRAPKNEGALGILADPHSCANVDRFAVTGDPAPARTMYLHTEAMLGAAQDKDDWEEAEGDDFKFGTGVVSSATAARAKWNIVGATASLWAPRGPRYGSADLLLDGDLQGRIDFHSDTRVQSKPLRTLSGLKNTFHSISLRNAKGVFPVDVLEVVH